MAQVDSFVPAKLKYGSIKAELLNKPAPTTVFIGRKEQLRGPRVASLLIDKLDKKLVAAVLEEGETSTVSYLQDNKLHHVVFVPVSSEATRYNCPARPDAITDGFRKALPKSGDVHVVIALEKREYVFAAGCAIARTLPSYSRKTKKDSEEKSEAQTITVDFVTADDAQNFEYQRLQLAGDGIRLAAKLVDMPTNELNTETYIQLVKSFADPLHVKTTIIHGNELEEKGFGGLWNVGKAAAHLPALVVLSHTPVGATKTYALVGKGIVYDTGGLSLKDSAYMVGMKRDMGGSAAFFATFQAAVLGNFRENLHAVLCLAENSVSAVATRPDDIIRLYSEKTVEVNNTDAEGRLVLGDGVAYASRHLNPDVIVDMATLTGAQGTVCGQKHAGIMSNNPEFEQQAFQAGLRSGDLTFPMLYCPEFLRKEFSSDVADMKNSVKDRANSPSSAAGHFIQEHLDKNYKGVWLHVDMAYPVHQGERATGYGVALMMDLLSIGL